MLKGLRSLLCCVLLAGFFLYIYPVQAVAEESTEKITVSMARFANPTLLFLPQGEEVQTLATSMPNDIFALCPRPYLQNLTATWDFTTFDSSVTGRQYIYGTVDLPETHAYYVDGVEAPLIIKQPVWVYSSSMLESEEVILHQTPLESVVLPLVATGSSTADIERLYEPFFTGKALCKTTDGFAFSCNAQFDASGVDSSIAGLCFPIRIETPPGISIIEDVTYNEFMAITVVDPSIVDLSGLQITARAPYTLMGSWLYIAEDAEVWITQDSPLEEGSQPVWQQMSTDETQGLEFQTIQLGNTLINARISTDSGQTCMSLELEFDAPPVVGSYWFKIRHRTGESNILQVDINNDEMGASTPRIGDRIGDNEGTDGTGISNEKPAVITSPNGNDNNTSSASRDTTNTSVQSGTTSVAWTLGQSAEGGSYWLPLLDATQKEGTGNEDLSNEVSGSNPNLASMDSVSLSGAELIALMQSKPEYVALRGNEVQVWLPTEALQSLKVTSSDTLTVFMDSTQYKSATVYIALNNELIELSQAFVVGIAWDGSKAHWTDDDNNEIKQEYDAENALLRLTLTKTGTVHCLSLSAGAALDSTSQSAAVVEGPSLNSPVWTVILPFLFAGVLVVLGGGVGRALMQQQKKSMAHK